jgi:hypothetical protein
LFLVAIILQAGPETQLDFSRKSVAPTGKALLNCLVLGIGVSAKQKNAPQPGYPFGLLQEGAGHPFSPKSGVNGELVGYHCRLGNVLADLCVFGLLVGGWETAA